MTDTTTQTWSVVTASEGHPDHDPGTTYSVSATGLTLDAALALVSDIEHEADELYDYMKCDCGFNALGLDGNIVHTCSGYPIVSAFHCLDAEAKRWVPDGLITIGDLPPRGQPILPHYELRKPVLPEDEPLWAYKPRLSLPNGPILSVPLRRREVRRMSIREVSVVAVAHDSLRYPDALHAHLDATPAPLDLTIVQMADLRDVWAVCTLGETQWMFRSIATGRWLPLPVSDLDGKSPAEVATIVEDALDRLHDLPAIHPAARSA